MLTLVFCLLLLVGCNNVSTNRKDLAKAEILLEHAPDSALLLLNDIRNRSGLSNYIKASTCWLN